MWFNCSKQSDRLFHTISFLQILFLLLKFYFFFKNKNYGQNIVKLSKSQITTNIEEIPCFFIKSTLCFLFKIESYHKSIILKVEIKIEKMKNLWFQIPIKI
jgi:hypothetical protein